MSRYQTGSKGPVCRARSAKGGSWSFEPSLSKYLIPSRALGSRNQWWPPTAASFSEIRSAVYLLNHLEGKLSFFDTKVSDPVMFESVEELSGIEPLGGGGTSFKNIFKYLKDELKELPVAIIILTDGEANYPDEDAALGVPVLWSVIDSDIQPPWGVVVHID